MEHLVQFITDPGKMLVVFTFIFISLGFLVAWKRFAKPSLLYAHLFFVLVPVFYFALSINCSMSLVSGLLSFCSALFAKFVLFIIPPLMALSFIGGFIILPRLYKRLGRSLSLPLFSRLCKSTGIGADLFLLDRASPVAFAVGRRVFVSVGLFELLSKKELEAVLLHELYHIKSRSGWVKFSSGFVRLFSPVAWFSGCSSDREEVSADAFAIGIQKTDKFIISARKKFSSF